LVLFGLFKDASKFAALKIVPLECLVRGGIDACGSMGLIGASWQQKAPKWNGNRVISWVPTVAFK